MLEKTGFPIALHAMGKHGRVEDALHLDIGFRPHVIKERGSQTAQGCQYAFALVERPMIADGESNDGGTIRGSHEPGKDGGAIRARFGEVAMVAQNIPSLGPWIDDRAGQPLPHRMQLILEGRHHAKVPPTATYGPEEVRVLGG